MATQQFKRELRLMKSTLAVSKKRDVSGTNTGKLLAQKGYINKDGMISAKGKQALKYL